MNIHETYVTLEVAKLLKQAGFDWECIRYYQNNDDTLLGPLVEQYKLVCTNFNVAPIYMDQYSAPTLEVAQKWLREVNDIRLFVNSINDKYVADAVVFKKNCWLPLGILHDGYEWVLFDTYEEALEAGMKKCLEIILNEYEIR